MSIAQTVAEGPVAAGQLTIVVGAVIALVTVAVTLVTVGATLWVTWRVHRGQQSERLDQLAQQQRADLRHRLRIAYGDFFSSIHKARFAKFTSLFEEDASREAAPLDTAEKRESAKRLLDASTYRILEARNDVDRAVYMIRMLEEKQKFVGRINSIYDICDEMVNADNSADMDAASDELKDKIDQLISEARNEHPLLGLRRGGPSPSASTDRASGGRRVEPMG